MDGHTEISRKDTPAGLFYEDKKGRHRLYAGDCLAVLAALPEKSAQCCVTSPPYWGLRDYGTAIWEGGDEAHAHRGRDVRSGGPSAKQDSNRGAHFYAGDCECGAKRIDAQLGQEQQADCLAWARRDEPCRECYVCAMRRVFAGIWRVLRDDGVLFLNLGDSYCGGKGQSGSQGAEHQSARNKNQRSLNNGYRTLGGRKETKPTDDRAGLRRAGLKPKDLAGIPWRVALALQADGWTLRSDIIWAKAAPMPESVTDRPTKAHEYIFVLTKSSRYFWDAEAIAEPSQDLCPRTKGNGEDAVATKQRGFDTACGTPYQTRNIRSVWSLGPESGAAQHYATYPTEIPRRAIKAGTSEYGACADCGTPYTRIIEKTGGSWADRKASGAPSRYGQNNNKGAPGGTHYGLSQTKTMAWQKVCQCATDEVRPCVVLEPFCGSGTTPAVAAALLRDSVSIELNPDYCEIAAQRIARAAGEWRAAHPLKHTQRREVELPLFGG